MTKNKLAYEAPKTETQELRFEGIVCGSPFDNNNNTENLIENPIIIGL